MYMQLGLYVFLIKGWVGVELIKRFLRRSLACYIAYCMFRRYKLNVSKHFIAKWFVMYFWLQSKYVWVTNVSSPPPQTFSWSQPAVLSLKYYYDCFSWLLFWYLRSFVAFLALPASLGKANCSEMRCVKCKCNKSKWQISIWYLSSCFFQTWCRPDRVWLIFITPDARDTTESFKSK